MDLTNEQLGNKIALKMGWRCLGRTPADRRLMDLWVDPNGKGMVECLEWDPCRNYCHCRLVEEYLFSANLTPKFLDALYMPAIDNMERDEFNPLGTTARQRIEAAYLTLHLTQVWGLLVSIGGANESLFGSFWIAYLTEDLREWRFQGNLGFGGKYRPKTNTVDCYPEDETPERLEIIQKLNKAFAEL